jgi:predicted 3-demethylubiquinone-9 3-methyltransferase (glyoxalase superfamily)
VKPTLQTRARRSVGHRKRNVTPRRASFYGPSGKAEQCGWLKDRYGVFWQIVPTVFGEMMKDPDRARAKRVAEAMLKMVKFDIQELKRAYDAS